MRDGLVVVDKPAGCTSHDVVARLRHVYRQRRVGHAGTLDPDATGVLLVGLGRVTRLLRFLAETGKAYRGDVVFGVATSTLDGAGAVLDRTPMPVTRDQVDDVARHFVGELQQVPPMVSALKVGGRRLHDLARQGVEVERASRSVRIDRLDLEHFEPGPYPVATILVECSSGTYVRSLAADLGAALGGCAHLGSLRRLRVGSFDVSEAHTLETIAAAPDEMLLPPVTAMRDLERLDVDDEQARAVRHGMTFPCSTLPAPLGAGPFAVADGRGELLAVYERRNAGIKPAVVVAATPTGI
ncbi:MAG TPA: tRNA pseudouridine(55) synthase TruB [Acidimicrobiia bacterium]|nr:tRNA pseudouridine(55) synthase TruB [Acidimicrobiia bacterium]